MTPWLAGTAVRTFEVPVGTELGGFADRASTSTGTHDALEIGALVLRAGDATLYLVAVDLIGVDPELVDEIASRAGIDSASLIVAASHTHSGPLGVTTRLHPAGPPTVEPALREAFIASASYAIREALSSLVSVTMAHGETTVPVVWRNRNRPEGPADDRVRFLVVRDQPEGTMRAVLLLVPCHPTVLGAWNLDVSADLHGGIRRALGDYLEPGTPVFTITGAAGDISTRYTRRESSFAEVDRLGSLIAGEVAAALSTATAEVPAFVAHARRSIELTPRPIDPAMAASNLQAATDAWDSVQANPTASEGNRRLAWTRLQGATIQSGITRLAPVEANLSAWRLGDSLTLVTIPGELFSSLGQQIEHATNSESTWVVGYANGYAGYLVDQDAVEHGTYEAFASPWSAATASDVSQAAIDLIASLDSLPASPSTEVAG